MATSAVARETVCALRHAIARIEGIQPEMLDDASSEALLRRKGRAQAARHITAGAERFDAALRGGLPQGGLSEIHAASAGAAGYAGGFALAMAARALEMDGQKRPVVWVGAANSFREEGHPYAPGLLGSFGIAPQRLLYCETARLEDALWVAEEAAATGGCAAVILEVRGNPRRLDLTATRRLHHRALHSVLPVFLLREAVFAEPTAAPMRLVVGPAPAAPRMTLAGPFAPSIGRPAFTVTIDKARGGPPRDFILEWNSDEHVFSERPKADSGALVSLSGDRAHLSPAAGSVLAFPSAPGGRAGRQPPRGERAAHRGSR